MKLVLKNNLINDVPVLTCRFISWFGDDDSDEVSEIKAHLNIKDNPRMLKLFRGLCHFISFCGNNYYNSDKLDEYFSELDYADLDEVYDRKSFRNVCDLLSGKLEINHKLFYQINEFLKREEYFSKDEYEFDEDEFIELNEYIFSYSSVPYSGSFDLSGISYDFSFTDINGQTYECDIIHIPDSEKKYRFTVDVGDRSNDGHGIYESVSYESSFTIEEIESAFVRACDKFKISFDVNKGGKGIDVLLSEYQDDKIDKEIINRLIDSGLEYEYDDEYDDYVFDLEDSLYLLICIIRSELPGFKPKQIPTLNDESYHRLMNTSFFYGIYD